MNYLLVLLIFPSVTFATQMKPHSSPDSVNYITLSQEFLYAVRTAENSDSFLDTLKHANLDALSKQLKGDQYKLAFWLNIYNAFIQISLKNNPEQYKTRGVFFSKKNIQIGPEKLSLDEIEHGILRRSKVKWSLGYLNRLFPSSFEKKFRTEKLDYRIHFALNCGAKSCPPIAFYEPKEINTQLDLATRAYLQSESVYNEEQNVVSIPILFKWFRADFGGKNSIIQILKKNKIVPENETPGIRYNKYDWTLYLDNYK
jgi:hypothetical protein